MFIILYNQFIMYTSPNFVDGFVIDSSICPLVQFGFVPVSFFEPVQIVLNWYVQVFLNQTSTFSNADTAVHNSMVLSYFNYY